MPVFLRLLALLFLVSFQGTYVQDIAWQAQFSGPSAVNWSTLGVLGTNPDNTAALNALSTLPPGTPIVGDCPSGTDISFDGTWLWSSGLNVWLQDNCHLVSTVTTLGTYPITNVGGFTATAPVSNIAVYGLYLRFATPTNGVRAMQVWADHAKVKYFTIDGGGVAFWRGSDVEIAYGKTLNVPQLQGNPGIRYFGNLPAVATSPGMHANVWLHNLNFEVGDAAFQACQPSGAGTWGYDTSTDGLMYENSYGFSHSSVSVILVNEGQTFVGDTYSCKNISFVNVSGKGFWYGIIGDSNHPTDNVTLSGGTFDGSITTSGKPALGIGAFNYGGVIASRPAISNVHIIGVTILTPVGIAIGVSGAVNTTISGLTVTAPRIGVKSTLSTILITGAHNTVLDASNIDAGKNQAGISVDGIDRTTSITNTNVTNVGDGNTGIALLSSYSVSLMSNTVTPAAGSTTAVGIGLTFNPHGVAPGGTNNATVTGNDVSAMPAGFGIVCANNQGNVVMNNAGASDCPP